MPRRSIKITEENPQPDIIVGKPESTLTHYQKYKDTIKKCQQRHLNKIKEKMLKEKMLKDKQHEKEILIKFLKQTLEILENENA